MIERWRPTDDRAEVLEEQIEWHPAEHSSRSRSNCQSSSASFSTICNRLISGGCDVSDPQFDAFTARVADRYAIGEEIGRGRQATVYRARDVASGATVAVKVFHTALASALDSAQFRKHRRSAPNAPASPPEGRRRWPGTSTTSAIPATGSIRPNWAALRGLTPAFRSSHRP